MRDPARRAAFLNALLERRAQLEGNLRGVGPATSTLAIKSWKRQLLGVNQRIARLERLMK